MKQTPVCVLYDWLISNSTSKDNVERWMSKDSRYARSTERGYKPAILKFKVLAAVVNLSAAQNTRRRKR